MPKRNLLVSLISILVVAFGLFLGNIIVGNTPSLGLDLQGGASVTMTPIGEYEEAALSVAVDIIRPRSRRNKQAAALVASTAVGDEVVLTSGIYGFVSAVEDDILWVDIADGHGTERIEVRVSRSAVARKIVSAGEADDSAKK